jgi:PAS domain S-box-containing protein
MNAVSFANATACAGTEKMPWHGLALRIVILATAYFVTGKLGVLLAIPPGYATAIWPPSGIALAGILLFGWRAWPGVLIGSFLVNVATNFDSTTLSATGISVAFPLVIGAGAALQAAAGAFLVRRYGGFPNPLSSEREVFSFLLLGGLLGCLVNATIAVSVLWASGKIPASSVLTNWGTWWIGDAMGVFIFTPLVLAWTLRPREDWKERRLVLTVPVVLAFLLTTVAVAYSVQWERERLALAFERHASSIATALDKALGDYDRALRSLRGFHRASAQIDRDEFRALTAHTLAEFPSLRALSWDLRVAGGERAKFEAETRRQGAPAFEITERIADGRLVRAAERPEYVAVHFIEPIEGNKRALGFDVNSDPTRRAALDTARDTGKTVATGRVTLVQDDGRQAAVLVFLPIYRNGQPHDSLEDRRRSIQGFMVGVLTIGDVLESVMGNVDEPGVVHRLLDEAAPAGEQVLFECEHASDHGGFLLDEKGLFGGTVQLRRTVSVTFGERQWQLDIQAGQKFFTGHRTENSWLILFAGLVLTSLVGAFVLVVSGRNGILRRLVAERTAALQDSEIRLLAAQQIAQMGDWDHDIVNDRLSWSDELFRVFGLDAREFKPTFQAVLERVHPEDRAVVTSCVSETLAGAKPFALDHRIVLSDGSERIVHARAEVVRDSSGRPVRMMGTVHDITGRKEAEVKLRRMGDELNIVLQSAGEGIFGTDADGRVTFVNETAAKVLGWEVVDLLGRMSHETFHHSRADESNYARSDCPIYLTGADGTPRKVEDDLFWRKDGSSFPVQYVASPRMEKGIVVGVVVVFEDITERKRSEVELQRSNAELQQFSYAVSHDLQAPLRNISGFLSLLEKQYKGKLDDKADQYIGFAVNAAKRMSAMIRDLLEYSRIQAGNEAPEPVDIGEVVRVAIDNLSLTVADAGAEVVIVKEFPTVLGNSGQLTRVFQNLIGNAIKYHMPGRAPRVSINVDSVGRRWVFSVADNGLGIEPQHFDRIFGVFQRLHGGEDYDGTGIGLALVKRIIEQHGGQIWLASEPGEGSTFSFSLDKGG